MANKCTKGSTHYLGDKQDSGVPSESPSSGFAAILDIESVEKSGFFCNALRAFVM